MHFFSVYSLFVSIGSLFVFCFPEEASDVGVKSSRVCPTSRFVILRLVFRLTQ